MSFPLLSLRVPRTETSVGTGGRSTTVNVPPGQVHTTSPPEVKTLENRQLELRDDVSLRPIKWTRILFKKVRGPMTNVQIINENYNNKNNNTFIYVRILKRIFYLHVQLIGDWFYDPWSHKT